MNSRIGLVHDMSLDTINLIGIILTIEVSDSHLRAILLANDGIIVIHSLDTINEW